MQLKITTISEGEGRGERHTRYHVWKVLLLFVFFLVTRSWALVCDIG